MRLCTFLSLYSLFFSIFIPPDNQLQASLINGAFVAVSPFGKIECVERLKVGDNLLSRDIDGNMIYVPIKTITKHKIDYAFKVFVEGSHCSRWHNLSPQQTVYDPVRDEWVQAQHINKATTVLDSDGNHCSVEKVVVEKIEGRSKYPNNPSNYAYSIELESAHVFFSAARYYDDPEKPFRYILVHNGLPVLLPLTATASFSFGSTLASASFVGATVTASKLGLAVGIGLTGAGVAVGVGVAGYKLFNYFFRKIVPEAIERTSTLTNWSQAVPVAQKTALSILTETGTLGVAVLDGATETLLQPTQKLTLFKQAGAINAVEDVATIDIVSDAANHLAINYLEQAGSSTQSLAESLGIKWFNECPECLARFFRKKNLRQRKRYRFSHDDRNSLLNEENGIKNEHVIAKPKHGFSKLEMPLEQIVEMIELVVQEAFDCKILFSKGVQTIGKHLKKKGLDLFVKGNMVNNVFRLGTSWLRDNVSKRCSWCDRPIVYDDNLPPFSNT
ncbi:hypothetical protein KAU11_00915 [Candidatus Babeliales bacterium]|nr:hypothetical protein [Candidatus Babeliales bacterium]